MESQLIQLIKESLSQESSKYLGDDCAVIQLPGELGGEKYLLSLDTLVEGNHFTTEIFSPYDIGWKLAAVNISDICAMAGKPLFITVGLSLPKLLQSKGKKIEHQDWVQEFYKGLQDCARSYGNPLIVGGDITSGSEISVSASILGKAHDKGVLLRSAAKPGDKICVTGKFGNSKNYLDSIRAGKESEHPDDQEYYLKPKPRLEESQNIWASNEAAALMDASDGLAASLIEIAQQSKVKLQIEAKKLPKDPHTSQDNALYGGEDFELVGCFQNIPEGFVEIGQVLESNDGTFSAELILEDQSSQILRKSELYRHF